MKKYKFISVDLQNDFATEGGRHYKPIESVKFLKEIAFPYFEKNNVNIYEIISDYRQPRPGDVGKGCVPGTWGYESVVPRNLVKSVWIKSMNSPIWVRDNIGKADKVPGLPRQDPESFTKWLKENIGEPDEAMPILFGLTIDCCVLSALQELTWRGYHPSVLKEGVDHRSGKEEDKESVLRTPVSNWADIITWDDIIKTSAQRASL